MPFNSGEEGNWMWIHTGKNITDYFWGPNSPNLTDVNTDDCGVMVVDPLQIWWKDTSCLTTSVEQKKVAIVCQHDRGICRGEWQHFEGHCYQLYSNASTWNDAENDCKSKGGHLASIHSEAERVFVYNLAGKTNTWVGGSDLAVEASNLFYFLLFHY